MTSASATTNLPVVHPDDRRRAQWLYDRFWGRTRQGAEYPLPEGTSTLEVQTPAGFLAAWHLPGTPGKGTVVLAHPDRRYGGHWFVREGWIEELQRRGLGVVWFDQPGYGRGNGGSPFLYENVLAVTQLAFTLDVGPVRLVGLSLGAFAAALAAAHLPNLAALVMESPYPTFNSWYEGRGWSMDRAGIALWTTMFRRSMPAVDATVKFAHTTCPALVAWSRNDDTTPPDLSERVAKVRECRTYVGEAEHLHLWDEPTYRALVLDLLEHAVHPGPTKPIT